MKLVTAIIKPHKLDDVKAALKAYGVKGMTITESAGFGHQGGKTEVYRGTEYRIDVLPKARVEVLCEIEDATDVASVIASSARTGRIGDGKVWITEVETLIRIRTGEVGDGAI